jgi:hypothetical protein
MQLSAAGQEIDRKYDRGVGSAVVDCFQAVPDMKAATLVIPPVTSEAVKPAATQRSGAVQVTPLQWVAVRSPFVGGWHFEADPPLASVSP